MDDYERVLLVKPDVHVYKISPRVSNRAYRASEWNLDQPDWNCRLRLIAKGDECYIKLDEKSTGQFFGKCPIDKYPGPAVESVSDSSRYFVLRLINEQTNRSAFIGIGFSDRSDSFDLNVALQDHFKIVNLEHKSAENEENPLKLDLKFKEGETIKVNLNLGNKSGTSTSKPRPSKSSNKSVNPGAILLPPPPGSKAISSSAASPAPATTTSNILSEFDSLKISKNSNTTNDKMLNETTTNNNQTQSKSVPSNDDHNPSTTDIWTDFTSCNIQAAVTTNKSNDGSGQSLSSSMDNDRTVANSFDEWAKF